MTFHRINRIVYDINTYSGKMANATNENRSNVICSGTFNLFVDMRYYGSFNKGIGTRTTCFQGSKFTLFPLSLSRLWKSWTSRAVNSSFSWKDLSRVQYTSCWVNIFTPSWNFLLSSRVFDGSHNIFKLYRLESKKERNSVGNYTVLKSLHHPKW